MPPLDGDWITPFDVQYSQFDGKPEPCHPWPDSPPFDVQYSQFDGKPEPCHPWPDSPPYYLPQSHDSADSSHPQRPPSRASSFGSIDSGVSHPPKAAGHRTSHKKELNVAWNVFDYLGSEVDNLKSVGYLESSDDLDNGSMMRIGKRMHEAQLPEKRKINRSADDVGVLDPSVDYRSTQSLACPFYRMSPVRYLECINHRLRSAREVQQHILCRHAQVQKFFHCPTCYRWFSSSRARDGHIRTQSCTCREYELNACIHGASVEVLKLLRTAMARKHSHSPDEHWYRFWDILFENAPRPQSPYLGTAVYETLAIARDFWRQEGSQMISEALAGTTAYSAEVEVGERLMHEFFDRLEVMAEMNA